MRVTILGVVRCFSPRIENPECSARGLKHRTTLRRMAEAVASFFSRAEISRDSRPNDKPNSVICALAESL